MPATFLWARGRQARTWPAACKKTLKKQHCQVFWNCEEFPYMAWVRLLRLDLVPLKPDGMEGTEGQCFLYSCDLVHSVTPHVLQEPRPTRCACVRSRGGQGEPSPCSLVSLCKSFALLIGLFSWGGQSCHFLSRLQKCVISLCLAWLTLQSPIRFFTEISTYFSSLIKLHPSSPVCLDKYVITLWFKYQFKTILSHCKHYTNFQDSID